jgi:hypothetical protein
MEVCESCRLRAEILASFRHAGEVLEDWRIPYILAWRSGIDPFLPLFEGDALSQQEVAERLAISQPSVSRLEKRAREFLQQYNQLKMLFENRDEKEEKEGP